MRYFSYGGGVQSTAALILAAQGKIKVDGFLFANVGEDSEHPDTLRYVQEVAIPYAQAHGIPFHELRRYAKDGRILTVTNQILNSENRSIGVPVRMANGAPGNRACTADFKIAVTAKFAREHGASWQNPATMLLGISIDEFQRMRNDSGISYINLEYPLIDLRLSRQDCMQVIRREGIKVPRKSSCFYCMFKPLWKWQEMRQNEPDLFWFSVAYENASNVKRFMMGRDRVYFSSAGKPLDLATSDAKQLPLFPEEEEYSCGPFTCAGVA